MDAVLEQFLSEARENLVFLDKNLAKLADGDEELVNALFRAAHTLKGGAGLVGLEAIKIITHYAEDLLDGIKKGEIQYTDDMLDVLYDAFDEIVEMIDATEEQGKIPKFDEEKVQAIADSVKTLTGKVDESVNENALDTELNIQNSEDVQIGDWISNYNISSFIHSLELSLGEITQEFIESDHIYLVNMDLDEETCRLGNDPVYLAYLLGSENIHSITCKVFSDCKTLLKDPTLWKTQITLVVTSNKEALEDSLYNILDDVTIHPLSIKALLSTSYESIDNEIFHDFASEFKKLLQEKHYTELSEKLSAVTKVLNPESKEGFILSRLEVLLPYLEFEGEVYLELVHYGASLLGLISQEETTSKEASDEQGTQERDTVINGLKQQLKVLKFAQDETVVARVKTHAAMALEFIGIKADFDTSNDKIALAKEITKHILELHPQEDLSKFSFFADVEEEIVEDTAKDIVTQISTQVEPVAIEPAIEPTEAKRDEIQKSQKQPKSEVEKTAHTAIPKTVKIDQSDIDSMMDIIGELLVMKNALPYVAQNITAETAAQSKTELLTKYEEINRVTEQLQDIVMGMRLLPLSYIFSRYPKLVRETSRKLGKKIRFEEYGGDTKLDKMMIEKIADPLVHIIRNSLDHGIEPTEQERVDAGKEPQGYVKIGALSQGDKVEIIIEDDGRGIDVDKVLVKALSLGVVTEEQIEEMSEQEKLMMIFHPGLSTAEQITDISGRGVGTDAVMKTITELNGTISLESKKGEGTKVSIGLPVSVALTNVFCVKMNGCNYAIPTDNVLETIKISSTDMQIANSKPYARLRGEIIPLVFEPRLLPADQIEQEIQSIVIIHSTTLRYGLVVNEFVNQIDVVQKPLDGAINNHPMITGTSLLGNGEILFVLDVNKLIES